MTQIAAADAVTKSAAPANTRSLAAVRYAATLGQITSVLMRTQQYRQIPLADLEWMVVPGIAANQYAINEVKDEKTGATAPAAFAVWALVSDEVDRRLTADPGPRIRLSREDWTSGKIPWLVMAAGQQRATGTLLKVLLDKPFSITGLKTIGRTGDGKVGVRVLRSSDIAETAKN